MRYTKITTSPCSDDESQDLTEERQPFWLKPIIPWILVAAFASITLMLAMRLDQDIRATSKFGFFHSGYHTDFVSVRTEIQASQQRFFGSPAFHDNGTMYVPHPDPKLFVGDPILHPEIDYNWDNLTWGRYILITEDEAVSTWGNDIEEYWDHQRGGYVAGLDLFHTLHCLNLLRKALDPEHYPQTHSHSDQHGSHGRRGDDHTELIHHYHCIEQMRQYIMCSGDMTPLPTKYYHGLGRNYVDSDVKHTCRDFDALHDWVVDRYEGEGAVKGVF